MPHRIRHAVVALCAAFSVLILAPGMAFADDTAEAQDAYNEGMEAYFAGKYSEAILSFTRAYELDPNPIFLFNMSIAYEKAGNVQEAYDEAMRAQEGGLPDQAVQINEARIPALGIVLQGREVAGRVSGTLPCDSDTQCRSGFVCSPSTNLCEDESTLNDPGGENPIASGPFLGIPFSLYGWIGTGLAIVGTGLTATAVIIDVGLGSDIENYNSLPEAEKRSAAGNTIADDIESQQQTGQILLYSGAAFLASGAGLIVYDLFFNDGNEHRVTTIDVGASPDGASVRATWTF